MSESSAKTASSLAVAEKQTTSQRSGGCVGIFFQLFDWNRRFAKKKLFSKKLLPPARAKQASKKFKGDEKMPTSKLHLITDENKGGFPKIPTKNSKTGVDSNRNNGCGTRSPTLVARLMGLESMPVTTREKAKKGLSLTNTLDNVENKKIESRPQKLRRTEQFDSKAVTRFGSESGFQIRNVLMRTRKHYHNYNHPKFVSPVKSPRKCSSRASQRLIDAAARILEPGLHSSARKFSLEQGYNNGHSSCQSCGNLLDSIQGDSAVVPQPSSRIPVSPFGLAADPRPVSPLFTHQEDQELTSIQPARRCGLTPWPSSSSSQAARGCPRSNVALVEIPSRRRDRTPPRADPRPNPFRGTKDFISSNRDPSARARQRGPGRVESSNRFSLERRPQEETFPVPPLRSPVRKRRMTGVSGQVESRASFVNSSALKQRSANTRLDSVTERGFRSRLASSLKETDGVTRSNGNNRVTSFAFNAHARQNSGRSLASEKNVNDEMKKQSMKGDSIAALLEEKLKELTSQDEDEFGIAKSPKKSTAMILQELISALTAERPDITASTSNADIKHEKPAGVFNVIDHLSPGSVLEASFSSSSHNDSSGHILYTDSADYSSDQLHNVGPDLDSVPSSKKESQNSFERTTVLVNTVSRVLDKINLAKGRLSETGLAHAKQVVTNAELLFGNVNMRSSEGHEHLFLSPILLELEAIANIAWTNINILTGTDSTKSGNQYRGFLFDCLIECLDFKYGKYPNSGFKAWRRLPLLVDRETIIGDVEHQMKKWTSFVGMFVDEIVEWEMSHGRGKWKNFEVEAFEFGKSACDDILEDLVLETLVDLLG